MPFISIGKTAAYISMFAGITLSIGCSAQTIVTKDSGGSIMQCNNSAIEKSSALIQFILEDIKATYSHTGGGGISEIKQTQTNLFVVSIAQEERIDQVSYQLIVDENCKVSLERKEESSINFSQ